MKHLKNMAAVAGKPLPVRQYLYLRLHLAQQILPGYPAFQRQDEKNRQGHFYK